jgi:hypothetical protein
VEFEINIYKITTEAGGHGSIDAEKSVEHGADVEIRFSANEGYHISSITVDGIELSGEEFAAAVGGGKYTFFSVSYEHSISVEFEINIYKITTDTNGHGSIDAEKSVEHGADVEIRFSANTGYHISSITVDGIELSGDGLSSAISGGKYTFEDASETHSISVNFEINVYKITTEAGRRGSIDAEKTVKHGETVEIYFSANTGWHISAITIDGAELSGDELLNAIGGGKYVFYGVEGDRSIAVQFLADEVKEAASWPWYVLIFGVTFLAFVMVIFLRVEEDLKK